MYEGSGNAAIHGSAPARRDAARRGRNLPRCVGRVYAANPCGRHNPRRQKYVLRRHFSCSCSLVSSMGFARQSAEYPNIIRICSKREGNQKGESIRFEPAALLASSTPAPDCDFKCRTGAVVEAFCRHPPFRFACETKGFCSGLSQVIEIVMFRFYSFRGLVSFQRLAGEGGGAPRSPAPQSLSKIEAALKPWEVERRASWRDPPRNGPNGREAGPDGTLKVTKRQSGTTPATLRRPRSDRLKRRHIASGNGRMLWTMSFRLCARLLVFRSRRRERPRLTAEGSLRAVGRTTSGTASPAT